MLPQDSLFGHLKEIRDKGDAFARARAENLLFEQRLTDERMNAYASLCLSGNMDEEGWLESHADYLASSVRVDLPETFLAVNRSAALDGPLSEMGENQELVRVEPLAPALEGANLGDVAMVDEMLRTWKSAGDDSGNARDYLEILCERLSNHRKAVTPRFAAFLGDIEEDIGEDDGWPLRLRDRLGLAHLPWSGFPGPFPVALMRYPIKDIKENASPSAVHKLTVPTQLDQELNEVFHPSPKSETYGRTLHLAGDPDCSRKTSEVLHPRIRYKPKHIWKVGVIASRFDLTAEKLAELRENHLLCLQIYGGAPEFGKL